MTALPPFPRRSNLLMPVGVPRFIAKAATTGADSITLDLEDSIVPSAKAAARALLQYAVPEVGRAGAAVLVRVNSAPRWLDDDLRAAVLPGVVALSIPKVESAEYVRAIDARIGVLEQERGLGAGVMALAIAIESPMGVLRMEDVARASPRIRAMTVAPEDYCLAIGVEPSADGTELLYPVSRLVTVCRAYGIAPVGLVGGVTGYRDLAGFEAAARRARQLGCQAASCIHPDQVAVLNRVFAPSVDDLAWARRVVAAFEAALANGTAAIGLEGHMIDAPVYRRALAMLARAGGIAAGAGHS